MKSKDVQISQVTEELEQLRQRIATLEKLSMEHKSTEDALRSLAFIDELTGLYNRRGFLSTVENQFKIFKRNKTNAIVLFADVDFLKHINDNFGHQEGDRAIIDTASILRQTFRESDIIGRLGGDEFAVLAQVGSVSSTKKLMARLKAQTKAFNEANNRAYKISLSTGAVSYYPESKNSIEELLSYADQFMYTHKRERKSKVVDKALSAS
jgi:two-component system cell cycle response regulator